MCTEEAWKRGNDAAASVGGVGYRVVPASSLTARLMAEDAFDTEAERAAFLEGWQWYLDPGESPDELAARGA